VKVLIIGNGISGLFAAYKLTEQNIPVVLVSPEIPERSQSVMAAGGINAAIDTMGQGDTCELHIQETAKSGKYIEDEKMIEALCNDAPSIVRELADMGVLFNRDEKEELLCRSFGGQSKKRTAYAGASTGKQIVTALVGRLRKAEKNGLVEHIFGHRFLKALIKDSVCYGALLLNEKDNTIKTVFADAVVMATGGQNKLFGKTTGTVINDGFAAAELFTQGVILKNLEFIQYHPTTIETSAKRMLVSEAARGEGGRLFYYNDDKSRCYFMEDKFGPNGNLMSRDIVSKEMFDTGKDIYLDVSFLGEQKIKEKIPEIRDLCLDYINLDIAKEPIPVAPSVHFFMGGMRVNVNHETSVSRLYAIGECASAYHGANRLGGNSLLAAVHGAKVVSAVIPGLSDVVMQDETAAAFESEAESLSGRIGQITGTESKFPAVYIMEEIARIMRTNLGIVRNGENLKAGLESLEFFSDAVSKLSFDGTLTPYESYSLPYLLILAKAIIMSADFRKESRGAHNRSDYPAENADYLCPSYAKYENGQIAVGGESK